MMRQLITAIALAAASVPAWAGGPGTVPEPGVLPLLAIGAVGGLVLWARNRNKKK
jgi:PEP-CTERM motif